MSILTDFNPPFLPMSLVGFVYVETGVCEGKSLISAAQAGFTFLHGIELLDRHVQECATMLQHHGFVQKNTSEPSLIFRRSDPVAGEQFAELITGSSVRGGLNRAIGTGASKGMPFTFFLDAHFPGEHDDEWDPCDGQSVLLEEIRIILSYDWKVSPILVIDDALQLENVWWDQYGAGFPKFIREQWPTMQQVRDLLDPAGYSVLQNQGILYAWK